jgi:hypothetical protein
MQLTNTITDLQDYMFTTDNLNKYTKHIIRININPKASKKNIIFDQENENNISNVVINNDKMHNKVEKNIAPVNEPKLLKKHLIETIYKPNQKDSLFWCFYILKHGYSNYEMEINGQYFVIEKKEKFKYIELLRKNKELLKIHKIKPFTELEDDLANKDKISVKTFFALCILESINVLLVDKRKIFELTCIDIDESHPVNIIHRNRRNYEHHIELNVNNDVLKKYRETYYKSNTLDASIKSIGSYKVDELLDLCKKLDINITSIQEGKKKMSKKDVYELLVLNY